MSTAIVPVSTLYTVVPLIEKAGIRIPDLTTGTGDTRTFTWTPDLSLAEQTTVADIVAAASSETGLSSTDYAAVRAQMQQLRSTRQLGRNAFLALTTAQQMRILYDDDVAITEILLKLFRDS